MADARMMQPVRIVDPDTNNEANVSAAGNLAVEVAIALPTGANNIGDVDVLTVPAPLSTTGGGTEATALRVTVASNSTGVLSVTNAGTFATQPGGNVAHDAVDSGNPTKVGGQARTTNPTAVADADRSNFITDKLGKLVVVNSIRDLKTVQQTTITSSTSETTIGTAVASTFLDLYGLIITNTSATVTKVTIKDSTAGTTRVVIEIPATETRGFTLTESAAIPQATVNNNWTATCGTSVAAIEITALFVKNI